MKPLSATILGGLCVVFFLACDHGRAVVGLPDGPRAPKSHVVEIDIDDHGLAGLWMARAPNLKGLIARGTFAFSRVDLPTHSNQNNLTLLTGQYPDGHDVPANAWLSREKGFVSPVNLPGFEIGGYALYGSNPLLWRGDSLYRAVRAAGGRSAYVGELPPFEVGADEVHLSLVGTSIDTPFGTLTLDAAMSKSILERTLLYPAEVVASYHFDGPPDDQESQLHFTLRDAARVVRASDAQHPLPDFLFIWDFLALDGDPTSAFGADGPALAAIIDDYDDALGDLLAALGDKGLLDDTNILFTLDHGKVDTHNQVALGTHGATATVAADGQLAAVIAGKGPALGLDTSSYALLNEDGDAQLYARVANAGTEAGAAAQTEVAHKLVTLVQSGALVGVDTTRTMTADGFLGTRTFHDARVSGPNQADVVIFPKDDWTLNKVDAKNDVPGPFLEHKMFPYARHGGFAADELYVPLILAGPAFKRGVLLPHPVEHADVAPTALAALAARGVRARLATAARGPIQAAFVDDPGETIALPQPPDGARPLVLRSAGFLGPVAPVATPATSVLVIDVAGLYEEEVFDDPALAEAAAPLRALAARGTRFEDCWTRSRDWPVTEYELLSGGYPVAPYVPAAEDDPAQTVAPGTGLLLMPPAANRVANAAGQAAWRKPTPFPGGSLFDVAHAAGLTTALLGASDFHALHVAAGAIDVVSAGAGVADELAALATAHPRFFAVVAVGGARTGARHDDAAVAELGALAKAVADLAARAPDALVVVTSRGATPIDDPHADFYGAGSSRHVPLVLVGPGVRVGVVSGQPAIPADLPATILFGLGVPSATDVAQGTWAAGPAVSGTPQPTPSAATAGHALLRAFSVAAP
jgi:hypothetical protein